MVVMALVVWLVVAMRTWGQESADMPVATDTVGWRAKTPQWVVSTIDSLIWRAPEVVLLKEKIRVRNEAAAFWRGISLHLTHDLLFEEVPDLVPRAWVGFRLPIGQVFQPTHRLDEAELAVVVQDLKVRARELMKEREELLVELELAVQQYQTALLKAQKREVALEVHQASSDAVLEARDALAERLAAIQKIKLSIRLVEDRLKALIGEL
jgi:hypothetical protein